MKKGLLFATVGACLVLASVALAAAATTSTTFKMKEKGIDGVAYSGKVTADPPKTICVAERRVEVYHRGIKIATTLTEANGAWKVDGPRPPEGEEVTVIVKKVKRKGRTRCKQASVTEVFSASR